MLLGETFSRDVADTVPIPLYPLCDPTHVVVDSYISFLSAISLNG